MSCFSSNPNTATVAEPDPAKHVNYNVGMVLGVDDFTQEFAYLSGRDQWMARDLIGYGTVRGLKVGVDVDPARGPRVVVEPGAAVSPRGQMICVTAAQCAYLNDWLAERASDLPGLLGSPVAPSLELYVVLCYRDCPTDNVPIAGEPCRSEDQLMAPSRLIDNFSLELRFKKPNQREENAVRDFVEWLKQVEVSDAVVVSTPLDQFLQAIRDAAMLWFGSPPASPPTSPPTSPPADFMFGSPPAFLHIHSADACEYMRAAFRLWVTELRPKWIARWHGCAATHFAGDDPGEEDCVLLAELVAPVVPASPGSWNVADFPAVLINEERRPYVVHLRMLQEWMLCGVGPRTSGLGSPPLGGLPGPPGDKGPVGDKGPIGDKGPVGDKGAVGNKGAAGDKGSVGDKGLGGDKGTVGDKGLGGDKGAVGDKGQVGDKGPVGDKGGVGNKGPVGDQGPPGDPGSKGGDFVEHPPGLPRYFIVAAGIVGTNGSSRPPVYNGLKATGQQNGNDILLEFAGYALPAQAHQYIAKVLAVVQKGTETAVVTFNSFTEKGILVSTNNVPRSIFDRMELMVEISRFEAGGKP